MALGLRYARNPLQRVQKDVNAQLGTNDIDEDMLKAQEEQKIEENQM